MSISTADQTAIDTLNVTNGAAYTQFSNDFTNYFNTYKTPLSRDTIINRVSISTSSLGDVVGIDSTFSRAPIGSRIEFTMTDVVDLLVKLEQRITALEP